MGKETGVDEQGAPGVPRIDWRKDKKKEEERIGGKGEELEEEKREAEVKMMERQRVLQETNADEDEDGHDGGGRDGHSGGGKK